MWLVDSDHCLDLLQAAQYFDVELLQDLCTDMIVQSLDVLNCWISTITGISLQLLLVSSFSCSLAMM